MSLIVFAPRMQTQLQVSCHSEGAEDEGISDRSDSRSISLEEIGVWTGQKLVSPQLLST